MQAEPGPERQASRAGARQQQRRAERDGRGGFDVKVWSDGPSNGSDGRAASLRDQELAEG